MFADRRDAGRRLASRLGGYVGRHAIVLGVPRGGVLVAAEVARVLKSPLDVIVVRKLGCPGQPELGVGAVAEGGVRVLNESLIRGAGVTPEQLEEVTRRESAELERRVQAYRGSRPRLQLAGREVIVVDDGLATGYSARAAIAAVRDAGAAQIVLAVPVASEDALRALERMVELALALERPPWFFGIGEFYDDFAQTTDADVLDALRGEGSAGRDRATAEARC